MALPSLSLPSFLCRARCFVASLSLRRALALAALPLTTTHCGVALGSGGGFGATQGGVQDLGYARGLVEEGLVPPAQSVVVEALFSEHDLPLEGAPCGEVLCLRGATGIAPDGVGVSTAWTQVGLSSSIDPGTFERPPLALVAVVDVSGSMAWNQGPDTPGGIAEALLGSLTSELAPTDLVSLVAYGDSVRVPLDWTSGGSPQVKAAIDGLAEAGSTHMEAGLAQGFALAAEQVGQGREVRVVLFTDAQPNVGATTASEFEAMAATAADDGIGLTVLGLGFGLGIEVVKGMSHLRGGNAFSLPRANSVGDFLSENWPWFTFPIAHDLVVTATPSPGLSVASAHGFPAPAEGAESSALEISSVFLSKRRGALLLGLAPEAPDSPIQAGAGVSLSIAYEEPDGTPHVDELAPAYDGAPLDERGTAMPQPGLARAVSLAIFGAALTESLTTYETNPTGAASALEAALARLEADAAATSDEALLGEAAFWSQLLTLMQEGAPQASGA
jgi:Ca-activated chloride channel family protein